MLKVIGAGVGRTGTSSLKLALEQLGFDKCHHMREVIANVDYQLPYWQEAYDTGTTDWEALFKGYQASVDYPSAYFYETLMQHYPDAKVILTVRDPDRWYESAKNTIYRISELMPPAPIATMMGMLLPDFKRTYPLLKFTKQLIWEDHFEGRFSDKDFAIGKFNAWNESVKATVPHDRLLVYEVKQGWQPLCDFLDVPVPDTDFPHANTREEFQQLLEDQNPIKQLFRRSK